MDAACGRLEPRLAHIEELLQEQLQVQRQHLQLLVASHGCMSPAHAVPLRAWSLPGFSDRASLKARAAWEPPLLPGAMEERSVLSAPPAKSEPTSPSKSHLTGSADSPLARTESGASCLSFVEDQTHQPPEPVGLSPSHGTGLTAGALYRRSRANSFKGAIGKFVSISVEACDDAAADDEEMDYRWVPWQVRWTLTIWGVLPASRVPEQCRGLYTCYTLFMTWGLLLWILVLAFQVGVSWLWNLKPDITVQLCLVMITGFSCILSVRWIMQRELREGCRASALLAHMTMRGFLWEEFIGTVYLCWVGSVCFAGQGIVIILLSPYLVNLSSSDSARNIPHTATELFLRSVATTSFWSVSPMCVFGLFIIPSGLWQIWMLTWLHKYDLLCYAGALAEAIVESHHEPERLVQQFHKMEASITSRFRHASATWVQIVLGSAVIVFVQMVWLLSDALEKTDLLAAIIGAALAGSNAILGLLLMLPMAKTAETFEYDVVRALNTPLVLKHSQPFMGQQLLHHLKTLEWGFRVGGTVITLKPIMNVLAAVMVTGVIALSKSMGQYMGDDAPSGE